jgi:exodeoxyribonuclease V alpha subunit
MIEQEELTGTIEKCIYQNEQNGFSVFVLVFGKDKSTIVRGHMPQIQPGEQVTIQGAWVMHPKFGRQFEAKSCTASAPTSILGLKKYLGSGMIKGIGPKYAEKLVNAFGTDTLEIIDKKPHLLSQVDGIGPKRIEQIINAWHDQREISNVMVFLQDKGISPAYATKIYKKYGQESIATVSENPYRLAEEIWGIGFKTADQIALQLNFEKHSIKRVRAGILYALSEQSGQGHLYCELDELKEKTTGLLELETEQKDQLLKASFHDLYNSDKIKIVSHENKHFIALTKHYFTEFGTAKKIEKLQSYPSDIPFKIDEVYQQLRVSKPGEIELNENQQRGILTCLQNKISIVTGGPGTGKTTLIKKLIETLDDNHVSYKLAAPTGRAAKRMSESTGKTACTIHRLLEFDVSNFGFTKNENNALKLHFLIIDEASMLDIFLMYSILRAVPHHAHVVFIGDVDQLPSVGPGNVLHDMLESGKVAHIRLTQIFRQAQNSMIIVNAHRINQGEFPIAPIDGAKKDFIFIKENEPTNITKHLEKIYKGGLAKFGIYPNNATTLVPMNRGLVGTQKLNYDIQHMLNNIETDQQISHGGNNFKIKDRVMQIRNNYDKNVFNGDTGVIEAIDKADRTMYVNFLGTTVEYDFSELDELVLAYAISIHKSQGSEFDAAIIPIFMQHFMLLRRNLIYTAITRAKKLCIFIGQPKAIGMAINNTKDIKRVTFLDHYLKSDLTCR